MAKGVRADVAKGVRADAPLILQLSSRAAAAAAAAALLLLLLLLAAEAEAPAPLGHVFPSARLSEASCADSHGKGGCSDGGSTAGSTVPGHGVVVESQVDVLSRIPALCRYAVAIDPGLSSFLQHGCSVLSGVTVV